MKILTGAGAILQAAHYSPDGRLHGHTYEITGWWTGTPDALTKQVELNKYLSFFDHSLLTESVSLAEDLALRIMDDLGCESVDVSRPLERIFARIES